MRPLNRKHVNKYESAKQFAHKSGKTKAANVQKMPMRGGYRL